MKPPNNKAKTKLLRQIAKDLKSATGIADAVAKNACVHLKAGRPEDALSTLLDIEPELYDAKKLFLLATYDNGLGIYGKGGR